MRLMRDKSSRRWYIDWRDHTGKRHRWSAFEDKRASTEYGHKLEALAATIAAGTELTASQVAWSANLPPERQDKLRSLGVNIGKPTANVPLLQHIDDYIDYLKAVGRAEIYRKHTRGAIERILSHCGASKLSDVQSHSVGVYISTRGSRATRNRYLAYFRAFCNWMVREGRASSNPVANLKRISDEVDPRHPREPLTMREYRKLLANVKRRDIDRYWLYRIAAETGLRANEIRTLTVGRIDFGRHPTITVLAGYSKGRRTDVIPLKRSTARELKDHLSNKLPTAPAFAVPYSPSKSLKIDYEKAGISYRSPTGGYRDFHAFRSLFATQLSDKCDLYTLSALMRHHSGPTVTARYVQTRKDAMRKAIEAS